MIRFYNGKILAMNGNFGITDHEVWVDGDKIAYVGPAKADAPAFEREIDLQGNLLMPGFKNAHTHSAMTFSRSIADDMPLQPWLFDRIFPLEAKLNPERVSWLYKLAIMEYLTSGITAGFDMYFHRPKAAETCAEYGFRSVFCSMNETYETIAQECDTVNSISPLVSMLPSIHAEYTTSVEIMKEVSRFCHDRKLPFFTHISETAAEHNECIGRHGMTPTELFDSLGLFDYGGGGYHCVYLSDNDIEIFKKRGLWAVTCPASNAKLASGIAPLVKFDEAGMNMAIGTDGPGSNNALDMFREMYLACVLQKLSLGDAAAMDALKVLKMACSGSALAMGLTDCDCIDAGKQADMIVIDLSRPAMQPINNVAKNIVYSGSRDCVKLTMIAGKILYEDGKFHLPDSAEEVYANCNRIVAEMTAE